MPVRQWLQDLLDDNLPVPFSDFEAAYWDTPSLQGMSLALEGAGEVSFIVPRLGLSDEPSQDVQKWLIDLLQAGLKVTVYVESLPAEKSILGSASARGVLRHLYPYLKDGRIKVHQISVEDSSGLPRCWYDDINESVVYFSSSRGAGLLNQPVPDPVYRASPGSVNKDLVKEVIDTDPVPPERLESWMPIRTWHLEKGSTPRFERVFGDLEGAYIQSMHLHDPYCGVREKNRHHLKTFIDTLVKTAESVERFKLTMCELPFDNKNYMPRDQLAKTVEEHLDSLGQDIEVEVLNRNSFHDRVIDLILVNPDGSSSHYRYDLTGGIDKLLSKGEDTKIYRYTLN